MHFSRTDQDSLYSVIRSRRDMRHFDPQGSVDPVVLERVLAAAHHAPSVGLMQPWRFIRILDDVLRETIAEHVTEERLRTASSLGSRKEEFQALKVEGVRECAELLAVVMVPDDGTLFGRRTMPREMAVASCACAIQNMWLASRVENLGMGWVSLFDPEIVRKILQCPTGAFPLALVCLGPVQAFYQEPMLEETGWRKGRSLAESIDENFYADKKSIDEGIE
ncbi:MAG: 5,6-dimethylbenzimidazole synthase [Magnetococcales bacterium]|nr:5,6-dimethylbenzimidazole synthase [Magnetococcales bacterium]